MIQTRASTTACIWSGPARDFTSGSARIRLCCQNMKAQWAVRETAQMIRTRQVVPATCGPNSSRIRGGFRSFAACSHSSVSGTALRIQRVIRAGRMPTKKTTRWLMASVIQPWLTTQAKMAPAAQASRTPMLTAV